MKKILLTTAIALAVCMPWGYAEENNPFDPETKNSYPVFGIENQLQADLGDHEQEDALKIKHNAKNSQLKANESQDDIEDNSGRITKKTAKSILREDDPNYVPPGVAKPKTKDNTPLPVHLDGDHVEFENATGDFVAVGKVRLNQGEEILLTNYAFGNMKTGDIYLLEGGTVLEPGNRSNAKWAHYNYIKQTGELKKVNGRGVKDIYKADHALIMPDKLLLDQGGYATRCTAQKHTPCMHVEAKRVEIYPNDKMVAHNVKVYVKGKHVYSRKLWVNEFRDSRNIIKPSFGWDGKDNGFYAKLEIKEHLSEKDSLNVKFMQYSRAGFKPMYKLTHDERNWSLNYKNGWEEDDDYWYRKQNDVRFNYKPHYFVKNIPITYSGYYEYGLWSRWNQDNESTLRMNYLKHGGRAGSKSWHREYAYYLNHDPITLFGKDTTLHLTYGRKWVHEGLSDENRVTNMYYATIRQKINEKTRAWISYLREKQTSSMFDLGQPDMEREMRLGIQWRPTKNDVFSVVERYNVGDRAIHHAANHTINTRHYETTYNWYHRFCCWAFQVSYEKEWYKHDDTIKVQYFFYNW